MTERPDIPSVLAGLKDFQRWTVATAYERLWGDHDPVTRFLVADEVGLGKTLVAKGVVARTIDHLWDSDERIDIVYICSNRQIAEQNLRRLHEGSLPEIPHADRLTMLPTVLYEMGRRKINIISFTPGTSFHLGNSGGKVGERALLLTLLELVWGRDATKSPKWRRFFRGGAASETLDREMGRIDRRALSADMVRSFGRAVETAATDTGSMLADELTDAVDDFAYLRKGKKVSPTVSRRRYRIIGRLRKVLAEACIGYLEPDLVILDEFQRFGALLHGDDDAALLAQSLLGPSEAEAADEQRRTRVLLLSATPFKMYTLPDEPEGDDHYRDFTNTVTFLAGRERADTVRDALSELRTALVKRDYERARSAKSRAEAELRRVMARTERLAISASRDGMLTAVDDLSVTLTSGDVRDYADQSAVARALNAGDVLEYWRSTPYVFELMEKYQIKQRIDRDLDAGAPQLGGILRSRLRPEDFGDYREVDLANPKLRWLAGNVLDSGVWRLAWIPPSLPYYTPGGVYAEPGLQSFTKRLVFSAWSVAPKGIATMLSYEVERRLVAGATSSARRGYFADRRTGLLAFSRAEDRLSGMPVLALMYPSTALARAADPLEVASSLGRTLPLSRDELVGEVRRRVERLLDRLPRGRAGGRPAQAWYWAAPFLLDGLDGDDLSIDKLTFGHTWDAVDLEHGESVFDDHLREVQNLDPSTLGPRPDDLADVLVELAIGGPGVCALRALARVVGDDDPTARDLRATASDWAWALRSLFNSPELMAMLQARGDGTYWREVARHGVDGNLQSVLDEYAQVLMESRSLDRQTRERQLEMLSTSFTEGSGLRASTQAIDFFAGTSTIRTERRRLRTHFAVRYGRSAAQDDVTVHRESQVRDAFNSPFWPFVLASTSVGQEGLDFHHYSHAVVHWNLPSNPVDLEQREGRVHRFRGHAVRKNIARQLGGDPRVVAGANPWDTLFGLAADERGERSQIFPDWVYPVDGGASIERYVPVLPMSRERQQYRRLLRTLGAYRLTMGQPRQQDLIAYVGSEADLALDLAPERQLY